MRYNNSQFNFIIFVLTGLLICCNLSSCGLISASNSKQAETASFRKGELHAELNSPLEETWQAVKAVADNSKFDIKSSRADAFSAVLKADDAQQRKVEIVLEKIDERRSRVRIRIGLLGDAEFSNQILDQIKKSLR